VIFYCTGEAQEMIGILVINYLHILFVRIISTTTTWKKLSKQILILENKKKILHDR
jgi:hypothetical protein